MKTGIKTYIAEAATGANLMLKKK